MDIARPRPEVRVRSAGSVRELLEAQALEGADGAQGGGVGRGQVGK